MTQLEFLEEVIRKAEEKDMPLSASAIGQFGLLATKIIELKAETGSLIIQRETLKALLMKSEKQRRRAQKPFKIFGNRPVTITLGKPKKKKEKS
ncbi:MAG: hypothetical protein V3W44_10015 [Dehalococcoidales bacterium]